MTGRDYKNLMRLHRETKQFLEPSMNEAHRALSKLVDSAHNKNLTKYQPVNYNLLKGFIQTRKEAAVDSLDKVKKFEDFNKQKREAAFNKNHALIWFKEWARIVGQVRSAEAEVEEALKFEQNSIDYMDWDEEDIDGNDLERGESKHFKQLDEIDEIEKYAAKLNEDRIKFKVYTIHPIQDLKEDLEFCARKNAKSVERNPEQYTTVGKVKEQQRNILEKLELEAKNAAIELGEISKGISQEEMFVEEGVPAEAFELDSPDEELRLSVLQEFIIIDFKYKEKLGHIDETHRGLEAGGKYGGWSQEAYEQFQHVYEQYHSHNVSLVNCNFTLRDLIFDRLKRILAKEFKVDRPQLVKYEEWCNTYKYFNQQKRLVIQEWREARQALLVKAEAIFAEAFEIVEQQKHRSLEKERQQRLCQELYEKVQRWRNQKLEALEIQQKIDEMMKRQKQERDTFENEQRLKQREKEKQAIRDYRDRVEALKRQQENSEQMRLDRLNTSLMEQAGKDQERIEYRRKVYEDKVAQGKAQREKQRQELGDKERRLEKFYESVKPNVEFDPARMISYTEAELARRGVRRSHEADLFTDAKPLYTNFGYSDRQINSDARARIENRLRQAGLINNEYSRALINNVKPPTQPRRDNYMNANWNGFVFN